MLTLVAENGYQATNVPDVVTRARVSRSSFYQEFESKLDCFLVLCEEHSRGLIDEVLDAAGDFGDRSWEEVITGGMNAYLLWWRDRPEFARAFLVELPAAGTVGLKLRIDLLRPFEDLFAGLGSAKHFYFAHSYHAKVSDPQARIALVEYGSLLTASVQKGNIYGVQFHPEKSSRQGLQVLKNFHEICRR